MLLACQIPEKIEEVYALAQQIKKDFYGNRIVLFAPLYLSNYCINGCTYCPYHMKNKHITRKKLSQEEIKKEVKPSIREKLALNVAKIQREEAERKQLNKGRSHSSDLEL